MVIILQNLHLCLVIIVAIFIILCKIKHLLKLWKFLINKFLVLWNVNFLRKICQLNKNMISIRSKLQHEYLHIREYRQHKVVLIILNHNYQWSILIRLKFILTYLPIRIQITERNKFIKSKHPHLHLQTSRSHN
jgi:hypothetical protein